MLRMLLARTPLSGKDLARSLCHPDEMADARHFARFSANLERMIASASFDSFALSQTQRRADRRGLQRWIANPRIPKDLLRLRMEQLTAAAIADCELLVVAHDTMEVDLHGRHEPRDAAPLRASFARGYLVHSATVLDPTSCARGGVLCFRAWTRPWPDTKRPADKVEVERVFANENDKWIDGIRRAEGVLEREGIKASRIHVADNEASSYETLARVRKTKHWQLLVRAKCMRACREDPQGVTAYLLKQPAHLGYRVHVREEVSRARGAKPERREAQLELRFARVTLVPNHKYKGKSYRKGLKVDAVLVREVKVPLGKEPVEWLLFSVGPKRIVDAAQAREAASHYALRWGSEDMHKITKSGCALERTVVRNFESFERLLLLVMPAASQIARWTYAARESPQTHAFRHLDRGTLEALEQTCRYQKLPVATKAWTMGEVMERLAQIGGYERRAGQVPGWQVILRGFGVVEQMREMTKFVRSEEEERRTPERERPPHLVTIDEPSAPD
jgi:hypothetical protein